MRAWIASALLAAGIVVSGCSEGSKHGTAPPPVTYLISINAPDSTLRVGQTSQLTASPTRSDGAPVYSPTITWSSSDSTIASVNSTGLLSAKAPGPVTVTATWNGASANAPMRIIPTPQYNAAQIAAESVYVGQTIDLRAYLLNSGTPAFTDSTTWTSSDPTVGTVAAGVFTALKRGVSTITATRGSKVGVVDVLAQTHVAALKLAPDTLDIPVLTSNGFDAIATDSAGKRIYGRTVTWSVGDPSKLSVANGLLTAKSGGTTTVTAICEGAVATAAVRITAPSANAVTLTAPQTWMGVGKTITISSDVRDGSNVVLPGATLNWSSSDSSIARVSSSGVVTGVTLGKATITGEVAGHKGTIGVSVEKPLASIVFHPDTLYLNPSDPLSLAPSYRDADGNALTQRPATWTSSDTTVVVVIPDPSRPGGFMATTHGSAGPATLTTSSDGVVGTLMVFASATTEAMGLASPGTNVGTYETFDSQVTISPMYNRGAHIISSDPGVVSVQPDTATFTNGSIPFRLTTGHPGDASVTAISGNLSVNFALHVAQIPVTIKIATAPVSLAVGDSYRLTASAVSDRGKPIIDWSSSDPSVATVTDSGVVTGVAGGVVRILARAHNSQLPGADSAIIAIRGPQSPLLTAITPAELQAGGTATLTGQNFSTTASANIVTIDGVPAQVNAATATQLNITIPSSTNYACQPTHVGLVVVSTGPGLVTTARQMFASAPQQSIAAGDAALWSPADSRCNELAKGHGVYLLTISNGGTSASPWTGFSFMVDTGSITSTTVATGTRIPLPTFSRSLAPTLPRGAPTAGVLRINMDSVRRAALAHRTLLDKSRKLAARLGSPLPALRRAARLKTSADLLATALPDTGTRMFVRVPRLDTPDFCSDYRTIQGRVVYAGTHSIILEDVQSPAAGLMDDYYKSVGAEFDQTTYNVIATNFGDPMAMDQALGGPGRVTMVFTPAVNEMGPTGFVVSCDFYPSDVVPSSNQREMFYAVVPTTATYGWNGQFTPDVWKHIIRGTIAHETKHIASMAEHFARQAPQQEESWLEEGTAMHAMELWARTVTSMKWKGANAYKSAPYCDVRPTWSECLGQPYTMFDHFVYLHDFLTPSEQHTPLGSTDPSDASFYGSVWWLMRWAVDQYATDEGAFLRALTQEPALTGVANLSARTGRQWSDMVRDWSLATLTSYESSAFSPVFTPHDAHLTTPTWQLRDVFNGMAADFPSEFGTNGLLTFHVNLCEWSPTVIHAMPPGGVSFFYLDTCEGWKNFFRFQSDAGGPPSSALSIGLVRIQ